MSEVSDLQQLNKELKAALATLTGFNKEGAKTPGLLKKTLNSVRDSMGGTVGKGATTQMDHMEGKFGESGDSSYRNYYEEARRTTIGFGTGNRSLGIAQAGAQAVFAVGAGVAAAVPGIQEVLGQSANYYQASLAGGGSRSAINKATFSGLAGGVTSTMSPSTTAAILAARGITPGSQQYNAMIGQIGGAARYMNMANENAAVAMSGMTQGNMSSSLYAAGISTYNSQTGQMRGSNEIFGQLYDRMTAGRSKMSIQDVNTSIQSGLLGQQAGALGMSEDQKQLFFQYFRDRSGGKSGDLSKEGYGANPMKDKMRMTTSDTSVLNAYEKPMLEGFKSAADLIVNTVNPGLENLASTAGKAAGFLGGLSESRAGGGLGVAIGGLTAAIGTLTGAILGGAAGGAGLNAVGNAALKGGKMLLKGGAMAAGGMVVGNAVKGNSKHGSAQSRLGSAVQGAGVGAAVGSFVPIIGTATGAVLGGLIGGFLGGPSSVPYGAAFGGKGGPSDSGAITPIAGGTVGNPYGAKNTALYGSGSHSGQDYPVPVGTPVVAALDGVVIDENLSKAYGTYVQIDHQNGYQSIYGHLSEKLVSVGATVTKGQVIGKSGDTGHVTGPHLHYEVRKGKNNPVNPDELSKAGGSGVAASLQTLIGGVASSTQTAITQSISGVEGSETTLSSLIGSKSSREISVAMAGAVSASSSTSSMASNSSGNKLPADANASIIATLQAAGFTGDALTTAYGIVKAESGGRPDAYNPRGKDNSYGLFQINMFGKMGPARREKYGLSSNEDLYDPLTNAKVAYAISNGGTNFKPWTTYTSGKYQNALAQGGPSGGGVATPSIGNGGNIIAPQVTINASFADVSEANALRVVDIIKTEIEKMKHYETMGQG